MIVFTKTTYKINMLTIGIIALCAVGCSDKKEPPAGIAPPVDKDGRHFLADKPLKLLSETTSKTLSLHEKSQEANKRYTEYKATYSAGALQIPVPPPDEMRKPISLEKATEGIPGNGPLTAVIQTTLGEIRCKLLEKESKEGVLYFVSLARGINRWWNGSVTEWSDAPFYRGLPVYMVKSGEFIMAGLPRDIAITNVAYKPPPPPIIPPERTVLSAYALALFTIRETNTFDTIFMITAIDRPTLPDVPYPIGTCEPYQVVQTISGQPTTSLGIPLDEITIQSISFVR